MRKPIVLTITILLSISSYILAEPIRGIDLDFATIGNAGNTSDNTGYGAVDYTYQLGTYEITNGQWNTFVSLAGAPTGSESEAYDESTYWTGTNVPTNNVSWYEAAQFCNFLTSGDKYSGAYNFDQSGNFLGIDRASSISTYGTTYVIPTEDEWYKAAYYTSSGFSNFANGQNTIPTADNGWNYNGGAYNSPWDVGTGTEEQNGTYDMMGNVWEWTETLIDGSNRSLGGGCYVNGGATLSSSSGWGSRSPDHENYSRGFRVASIPEPTTLLLIGIGAMMIRKRK